VALPFPQFEFAESCVPRRLDRCIAVVLSLSCHKTVRRWTGLIQCAAFNSRFLPLHPYLKNVLDFFFLQLTDATPVYRTRYSLDIEVKTLHSECSLFKSSSSWVQILQTKWPRSPAYNSCTKTAHRMVCEAKKCQNVGNIVVNLLSQKENERNISSCTHSTPHTNFDVM